MHILHYLIAIFLGVAVTLATINQLMYLGATDTGHPDIAEWHKVRAQIYLALSVVLGIVLANIPAA